jgi:hypothetical protein
MDQLEVMSVETRRGIVDINEDTIQCLNKTFNRLTKNVSVGERYNYELQEEFACKVQDPTDNKLYWFILYSIDMPEDHYDYKFRFEEIE